MLFRSKDDEQKISEFVDKYSGSSNSKRYTIMNIQGFVYGGNSTGNSYLSTTANDDILDSFEEISCIFINVANQFNSDKNKFTGKCLYKVKDIFTIDCKEKTGNNITLSNCGKYRIFYVSGAGRKGI